MQLKSADNGKGSVGLQEAIDNTDILADQDDADVIF
jgi:hypothetical protein